MAINFRFSRSTCQANPSPEVVAAIAASHAAWVRHCVKQRLGLRSQASQVDLTPYDSKLSSSGFGRLFHTGDFMFRLGFEVLYINDILIYGVYTRESSFRHFGDLGFLRGRWAKERVLETLRNTELFGHCLREFPFK